MFIYTYVYTIMVVRIPVVTVKGPQLKDVTWIYLLENCTFVMATQLLIGRPRILTWGCFQLNWIYSSKRMSFSYAGLQGKSMFNRNSICNLGFFGAC